MINPHITILMATYDGAAYLPAQMDSLLAQSHENWSLMVSDDGSIDGTVEILRAFDTAHPSRNLRVLQGPAQGSPAQNFMSLLARLPATSGLVALADQDDVWLPQKLARAVDHLQKCPQNLPGLYAAESLLTDANLSPLRQPRPALAQPCFRNALVQNLFAGHSTVMNAAAVALVQLAGCPQTIAFHDWWLYQLISGAGGMCILDPAQTVLYRQHGRNAMGASYGIMARLRRLKSLLGNDYSHWLFAHWQALQNVSPCLTPEARDLVRDLLSPDPTESRSAQFRRLKLHRASRRSTTALQWAARFGWV